jgi:2-polyprenyl-6-methoxyphenol hydroxylase-like FAD-dependent oxidoreductase
MTEERDIDVIVVGAGPAGLLIASELALGGVAVQVIDRLAEPDPTVKAGSVNVATAEVLDRRGLRPALRQAQQQMMRDVARFAAAHGGGGVPAAAGFPVTGHFAAMMFRPDLVDQSDPDLRAHTAVSGATVVPQRAVEQILAGHAARLGVPVRRGVEVTGLDRSDDGVALETSAGPLTARWVVGADGGRSTVRKLAGFGFPGTDPEITGYQAIADLEGAGALRPGWTWSPAGVYSYGPVPGRILTVQFTGPPADRSAPVTPAELQASIRRVSGAEVTVTGLHGAATRWTDNARQADTYRRGRVLLAGDAAHVHSPFSGQGLNLGLGDAVNLGWKLAATIGGWAPAGLLDSYTAERHPIAAWVLDWTRAQVALMRGDPKTAQLRAVTASQLLGTGQAMTNVVALASGIAQRYAVTSGVAAGVGTDGATTGRPFQLGNLTGDVTLADGSRLADHAHQGTFVLLDRTPDQSLSRRAGPWADRVTVVTDSGDGPDGLLIRPDGVIIWAAAQDSPGALEAALHRWAGTPAAADPVPAADGQALAR